MLLITHDLGIVRHMARRCASCSTARSSRRERPRRSSPSPQHAYTKMLLAAEPKGEPPGRHPDGADRGRDRQAQGVVPDQARLLPADGRAHQGGRRRRRGGPAGQTLGVVGESGSGKTTLGLAILRLIARRGRSSISASASTVSIPAKCGRCARTCRSSSRTPTGRCRRACRSARSSKKGWRSRAEEPDAGARDERVARALNEVGIDPEVDGPLPARILRRPAPAHRDRAGAGARAALRRCWTSRRARSTCRCRRRSSTCCATLQKQHDLAYLFISHDLRVVRALANDVVVMRNGVIVEERRDGEIFARRKTAYTKALIAAALHLQTAPKEWCGNRSEQRMAFSISSRLEDRTWIEAMRQLRPHMDMRVWPDRMGRRSRHRLCRRVAAAAERAAQLPNLKGIFSLGAGVDAILSDPTLAGLPIVRVVDPDLTMRMSEYVVLHVLMHHRQQRRIDANQRRRVWDSFPTHAGKRPAGRRHGAGRARPAMRPTKLAHARLRGRGLEPDAARPRRHRVLCRHGELDAFLARTDILVLLLPLTPDTTGMIDAALIGKLSREGPFGAPILINAGRGGLQVEADILAALEVGDALRGDARRFRDRAAAAGEPAMDASQRHVTPHRAADSDRAHHHPLRPRADRRPRERTAARKRGGPATRLLKPAPAAKRRVPLAPRCGRWRRRQARPPPACGNRWHAAGARHRP